jgi:PilZ domain-containing protein
MIERRAHPRHKTFIKGRIYFNNRLSSMDCIVRDIGKHGSRLEFSENVTLPDVFELYLPNKDDYFQAHVMWRKGNNIGITWTPEDILNPRSESGRTDYHLADRVTKLEREVGLLLKRIDALER